MMQGMQIPMLRLKRQLSCLCSVDNFTRVEKSNIEYSKSKDSPTPTSWTLLWDGETAKRRLTLCWMISGMPREFWIVNGAFSFRE